MFNQLLLDFFEIVFYLYYLFLQDKMAPLGSLSKFMSPPPAHISSANLGIDPNTGNRFNLLFENVLIFSSFSHS
jgi:hypothetical protein